MPWIRKQGRATDFSDHSFIYSLTKNEKSPIKVTFSGPKFGPVFGHEMDIFISDRCDKNHNSYYKINNGYNNNDNNCNY